MTSLEWSARGKCPRAPQARRRAIAGSAPADWRGDSAPIGQCRPIFGFWIHPTGYPILIGSLVVDRSKSQCHRVGVALDLRFKKVVETLLVRIGDLRGVPVDEECWRSAAVRKRQPARPPGFGSATNPFQQSLQMANMRVIVAASKRRPS